MKPRLQRIMKRDNNRCGIHSGGCLRPVSENAYGPKEATQDHLVPRRFANRRAPDLVAHEDWNLQPMHAECNNARMGQVLGVVKFECNCHGSYVDERQNRWMMYKTSSGWERVKYMNWQSPPAYGHIPGGKPEGHLMRAQTMLTAMRNEKGEKISLKFNVEGRGHGFTELEFYCRLIFNAGEFCRTEQWSKLADEVETICRQIDLDQGVTFQKEGHGVDSLSEILYWTYRIEEENIQNIIGPHTDRLKTGIVLVKGAQIQEAKERSTALWYSKAQEQAVRSNTLGEWSKAETICDRALKRSERPDRPETREVIAYFYFVKISAQASNRDSLEEASELFECLLNEDRGPVINLVLETIEERDKKDFKFIANKVADLFERILREHIRSGRIVVE